MTPLLTTNRSLAWCSTRDELWLRLEKMSSRSTTRPMVTTGTVVLALAATQPTSSASDWRTDTSLKAAKTVSLGLGLAERRRPWINEKARDTPGRLLFYLFVSYDVHYILFFSFHPAYAILAMLFLSLLCSPFRFAAGLLLYTIGFRFRSKTTAISFAAELYRIRIVLYDWRFIVHE